MRIVHTSDWHAGRSWKGVDRLPELEAVLDGLARFIERERVDLLLMTGDVFDTTAPPPQAEEVVFRFFKRVGLLGVRSIVIAGNHDHPERLEAWGQLAELVGVTTVGHPRAASQGGVIEVSARSGETAVVAALPFAPTRQLVDAAALVGDEQSAIHRYADGMAVLSRELCQAFRPDAVNLLCAHTHHVGARLSGSERRVHIGDGWAANRSSLPDTAHYVALGHIHRPQAVEAPAPTRYAGSPLQLDFGEAGEDKSFVLIDASPGRPVHTELVPYEGGTPLVHVQASLQTLDAMASELVRGGWLRVTLPARQADPDIARVVRKMLPNAVVIDVERPEEREERAREALATTQANQPEALAPRVAYQRYHEAAHGHLPDAEIMRLFDELIHEASEDS